MHDKFHDISSIAEIPLFHGDQWEITVPSLLGLDQVLLRLQSGGIIGSCTLSYLSGGAR